MGEKRNRRVTDKHPLRLQVLLVPPRRLRVGPRDPDEVVVLLVLPEREVVRIRRQENVIPVGRVGIVGAPTIRSRNLELAAFLVRGESVRVQRLEDDVDTEVVDQLVVHELRRLGAKVVRLVVAERHRHLFGSQSRSGKRRPRLGDVELLRAQVRAVAVHALGDEGRRRQPLTRQHLRHIRVAVDGLRHRLAQLHVVEGRRIDTERQPEDREVWQLDQLAVQHRVGGHRGGLRWLNRDLVELAVLVLRQGRCAVVDDHEVDPRQRRLAAPIGRIALHPDVVVLHHLGDLERTVGDQRLRRRGPLVRALGHDVLPNRGAGGQRRQPEKSRVRTRQLDLESEIVDRLEAEGRKSGIDRCGVALGVHQRDALAVEDRVREQRLVV